MNTHAINAPDPLITISAYSQCSIGAATASMGGAPASSAWPAANRAIFVPFRLSRPWPCVSAWLANGATVAGTNHCDIGIYSEDGTRLASTGSTVTTGTNVIQRIALAATLGSGVYYMALALDSTETVFRSAFSSGPSRASGTLQQAAAFPLPATATFAALASTYMPVFGLSSRVTV